MLSCFHRHFVRHLAGHKDSYLSDSVPGSLRRYFPRRILSRNPDSHQGSLPSPPTDDFAGNVQSYLASYKASPGARRAANQTGPGSGGCGRGT